MLNGHVRTPDEIVALVDAVAGDDIRRIAAGLLQPNRLTMAIVGPFKSDRKFAALMNGA
jgi:predicted Zn-dependent peptidase